MAQFHCDALSIRCVTPFFFFADCTLNPLSHKQLFVDPHECARVVGFAFILDAVEAVPPLAVVPLVVVVVLHLPHCLKHPCLCELKRRYYELRMKHTEWTDGNTHKHTHAHKKVIYTQKHTHTVSSCVKSCQGEVKRKHTDWTDGYMQTNRNTHTHTPYDPRGLRV